MDKAILSHARGATASIAPRSNGLVLRRKCGCEGSCNDCQKKNGLPVRTKLRMSEPGDAQEREADDVANRLAPRALMRDEVGNIDGSGIADAVLAPLPRSHTKLADHVPGNYGTGSPLSSAMRSSIEPLLGYDLSTVRIYPKEADHVAADIKARAFTLGRDIYFRDGEYSPGHPEGMRVLLHELVHTTQPDVDGGMLLQRLPSINSWDLRNSGSTAPDNCATAAPGGLGVDTAFYGAGSFTNGIELQILINDDEPGATYDVKRTKERAVWQLVGGAWSLVGSYQPAGTDDDRSQADECLTPSIRPPLLPYIYSFDEPGFRSTAAFSASATEAVYKGSFFETVEIVPAAGGGMTSGNFFEWHSIAWLTKAGGSWAFDPARSEIGPGPTTVGTAGP